jgi:hypothetical protein
MIYHKFKYKLKAILKSYELRLLKNRAVQYGLELSSKRPSLYHELVINNFFNTEHQKNALISYIIYPFLDDVRNDHSNHRECYVMAEILNELGFNVDVINWDNSNFTPSKHYDLVIDNHDNLARLDGFFSIKTTKIFHATNAYWLYQNLTECKRHYNYFLEVGIIVPLSRTLPPGNSPAYCDAISMFGNDFTKNTYGSYMDKIHQVPISVTAIPKLLPKDFEQAKKKFVWFNSHGFLLKGLDVVIKAFSEIPDCELFICTDLTKEPDFYNSIYFLLDSCHNIKYKGWVDVNGVEFNTIVSECAWVINTSFSEGGGGSTLNCMAKGLIPIVSTSASIDLPEKSGLYLSENNYFELIALIREAMSMPVKELTDRSNNAYLHVLNHHTIHKFKDKYKGFILNALS